MNRELEKLFDALNLSPEDRAEKLRILREDMKKPVRIAGIGQTGVGKTELLKSIFRISEEAISAYLKFKGLKEDFDRLETGAVKSVTKEFFSFTIENPEGFRVEFTDGPGLGESGETDARYIEMWIKEIPRHDLLYWVLDASSRDMAHIQKNIKYVLDRTNYRDRLVVVLNKVDQILLPIEVELKGVIGWDPDLNRPSKALERLIEQRTDDIMDKLEKYIDLKREQMVACSARRRWNHGAVLDKILEFLPEEKRLKASRNREVKDFSELMSPRGRKIISGEEDLLSGGRL
ncbi:MAG TPA: GTPase [Candidatus Deferrimicrobium sp.]|nr:GTPase [Candidatus Deferrimicrobium sp.]